MNPPDFIPLVGTGTGSCNDRQLPAPADAPGTLAGRSGFWAAFTTLLLLVCLPFLITDTPALLDYPNHLARVYILGHWASDPFLHAYYQPNWQALP